MCLHVCSAEVKFVTSCDFQTVLLADDEPVPVAVETGLDMLFTGLLLL